MTTGHAANGGIEIRTPTPPFTAQSDLGKATEALSAPNFLFKKTGTSPMCGPAEELEEIQLESRFAPGLALSKGSPFVPHTWLQPSTEKGSNPSALSPEGEQTGTSPRDSSKHLHFLAKHPWFFLLRLG